MPAETLTFTAGPVTLVAGLTFSSTTRVSEWDWGAPDQAPNLADGVEGSSKVGQRSSYGNRTMTFSIERPGGGGGEVASRAWLQSWTALEGAVAGTDSATLLSTFATSTTLTFDIVSVKVEVVNRGDQGGLWDRGYARAKLTVVAKPFGRGAPVALSGSLSTSTPGVAVWTADSAVAGDVPALATITGTWTDSRREQIAAIVDASPTVTTGSSMSAAFAGWASASGASAGALNANVMTGPLPVGDPVTVATYVVTADQTASITARVAAFGDSTAGTFLYRPDDQAWVSVSITVNGREVQGGRMPLRTEGASSPGRGAWQPWRKFRAPRMSVRTGDVIGVAMSASSRIQWAQSGFATGAIDFISLSRESLAAVVSAPDPVPRRAVAGDAFLTTASGTLNGRAGDAGGTWAASNWSYSGNGATPTAFGDARIGSRAVSAAFSCRLTFGAASGMGTSGTGANFTFGMGSTFNSSLWVAGVVHAEGPTGFSVGSSARTSSAYSSGEDWHTTIPALPPAGGILDCFVALDEAGRWVVRFANAFGTWARVMRGHSPDLIDGGSRCALLLAGTDVASVTVSAVRLMDLAQTGSSGAGIWDASPGKLVLGDLPTLIPGRVPIVTLAASESDRDSPATPVPTAVSVSATPRYLQVPAT